jgi:hypothetical protein
MYDGCVGECKASRGLAYGLLHTCTGRKMIRTSCRSTESPQSSPNLEYLQNEYLKNK